jgi:thioredoxin 1
MTAKNILEINELNFTTEVLGSKEPFVLDFNAAWCGPCKVLAPVLEKLANENLGRIRVGTIDLDDAPALAAKFGVRGAPTVIVFKDGKESARQLGVASQKRLMALVDS